MEAEVDGSPPLIYGELIVLGYNGVYSLWKDSPVKPRSRFTLCRREKPSGIRRASSYAVNVPRNSRAVLDADKHSISYTLTRNQAVVVEYEQDPDTDMFQIGRSSEPQIDFTVVDTWLGLAPSLNELSQAKLQSTISRYACRIMVNRDAPHEARVYAAGFDVTKNIFLGEKATKWRQEDDNIDGLTTNGVLICNAESHGKYVWREVSINGDVYTIRETRSSTQRGEQCEAESCVLTDGKLIDLCGATLVYRTREGLSRAPTKKQIQQRVDELNASRPQCPVNLNTLIIPRSAGGNNSSKQQQQRYTDSASSVSSMMSNGDRDISRTPFVYLGCGHVQGRHAWGHDKDSGEHICPLCHQRSAAVIPLTVGLESAFHLDNERPDYAFNTCGHIASLRTVEYWSRIPMPQGSTQFAAVCPFCCTTLHPDRPFVRLIFQDNCY